MGRLPENQIIPLLAAGLVLLIWLTLLRRAYRARLASPPTMTSRHAVARLGHDHPDEMMRWEVEMHETARELKAELDSKIGVLRSMTRLAAEESLRLEAALDRATACEQSARRRIGES